jgi:deoxyhypusine monooxygenase
MSQPTFSELRECLLDVSRSIGSRNRAAYFLRTRGDIESIQTICEAIQNKTDSSLLRHELAYILGQLRNPQATEILERVLSDLSDDVMVRHEAAEALGAIGCSSSVPVLSHFANDSAPEVSETCSIAIGLIEFREHQIDGKVDREVECDHNPYLSIDPAPPSKQNVPIPELRRILCDVNAPLFERYRAMFSLRNRGTEEAVLALGEALVTDNKSSLFRHEVAFVLGQMELSAAIPSLRCALENENEHRMVRHEAAESIGSIGGNECERLLKTYQFDQEQVVKESCEAALDTMEYWRVFYENSQNDNHDQEDN